jgi:pimeloyl-ACP methyl ester carboxylesterase
VIETLDVGGVTVLSARPVHAVYRPILFVHGYLVHAAVFADWLPFFAARGFPAYAVNLRGRCGSRPEIDIGKASIQDFVDDAAAVARWLGRPAVVGHSMGGLIAQKLAEQDAVSAAALVTPAPPRGISVVTLRLAIKQLKYLGAMVRGRAVVPAREDMRELVLNRVPPAEQEALLDMMIPDSGRAGRDMSIVGVPVDETRVRCPLLVVAAGDDRFIPKQVVTRIATRYRAPMQTMIGRGHMVICEPEWESLADLIARWLVAV